MVKLHVINLVSGDRNSFTEREPALNWISKELVRYPADKLIVVEGTLMEISPTAEIIVPNDPVIDAFDLGDDEGLHYTVKDC